MTNLVQSFGIGVWIGLLIIAIALIWFGVSLGSMQKKFVQLGNLKGRTSAEITEAVGRGPSHVQHLADGAIKVWASFGYQISLVFDKDDVCLAVSTETSI